MKLNIPENNTSMKTKLILTTVLLFAGLISFAQMGFGKEKEIVEVYERKVIIVNEQYDERTLKVLEKKGKKGDITTYKNVITKYNADLLEAVKTAWPFDTVIVVKKIEDVLEMKKDKKYNYVVVRTANIVREVSTSSASLDVNAGIYIDPKVIINGDFNASDRASEGGRAVYLYFTLIEDEVKEPYAGKKPIIFVGVPQSLPARSDLTGAIQSAFWYMDQRLSEDRVGVDGLKMKVMQPALFEEKELYIRETDLGEKCTKQDIADNYPYKFFIVSDEDFDEAVMTRNEDVIYLQRVLFPTTTSRIQNVFVFIDAASGKLCGMVTSYRIQERYLKNILNEYALSGYVFKDIVSDIEKAK